MDPWAREDLDLVGRAYIEFGPDLTGSFRSIAVEAQMDWRKAKLADTRQSSSHGKAAMRSSDEWARLGGPRT